MKPENPIPKDDKLVIPNAWTGLRQFTAARIALGRAGNSLPTSALLEFQLAHALARDAVHTALDVDALSAQLESQGCEVLSLHSAAPDRNTYLVRPDLGRQLNAASRSVLAKQAGVPHYPSIDIALDGRPVCYDLAFVVADGLSALAVQAHAANLIAETSALLRTEHWRIAPVSIVRQGRVAIGDEVGEQLHAAIVAVLIGERPGLSSPDSLGVYLTYMPRKGCVDSQRNCISNVRPAGLAIPLAAQKLHYLLREARCRRISGVELKDESVAPAALAQDTRNFLTLGE
jgi:ethanolamine ammonia-lyase small subunit